MHHLLGAFPDAHPGFSTVLSSAGNDGRVRVWKATAGGVWRPAGHISVEQADQPEQDVDMIESGERRRT